MENSVNYTAKSLKVFDNSGTEKVRNTKISLDASKQLRSVGHTFDSIISVGHYNTTGQKKLNLKFTYYMYNGQDIYAPDVDLKTSNLSLSYWSA